jgi:hypothetical protein
LCHRGDNSNISSNKNSWHLYKWRRFEMLIDLVQIPQTRFKFMLKNSVGQITFNPIKAHTVRSLFLLFLLECRQIQAWSNSLFSQDSYYSFGTTFACQYRSWSLPLVVSSSLRLMNYVSPNRGHRVRHRMVVGFAISNAISTYHH